MPKKPTFPVIDLFAGPGGLGEGFSTFDEAGHKPFKIALSVEKDPYAHETLRLRSFFRQFAKSDVPDIYYQVLRQEVKHWDLSAKLEGSTQLKAAWESADHEAMCAELGPSTHNEIRKRITGVLGDDGQPWVLIGGPPCQAYSLAGRVRNKGVENYKIETDKRSKLYEEYLRIIAEHRPTVFVMENVKGMLSATIENKKIFEKIISDLQCPDGEKSTLRYRIVPVVAPSASRKYGNDDPRRFIVRCEEYGVPQQRHRVILIGVIDGLKEVAVPLLSPCDPISVFSVIDSLVRLRSGISRRRHGQKFLNLTDDADAWLNLIKKQVGVNGHPAPEWLTEVDQATRAKIISIAQKLTRPQKDRGGEFVPWTKSLDEEHHLYDFLVDERLGGACNHSTRGHMDTDLARYLFCAAFANQHLRSPRLDEFPAELLPKHKNVKSGKFNDRFKVQLAEEPATTITSHIAKDGHHFIHYDPTQCRSLTVREAARLQTFPDNYYFCGPRTEQYTQVGNAVPPWIARQIANSIWKTLVDGLKVS